jgi:hypothetical protein
MGLGGLLDFLGDVLFLHGLPWVRKRPDYTRRTVAAACPGLICPGR